MFDLRADGTIGIDFEDGRQTVVLARPKFGAYKRIRAEAQRRIDAMATFLADLREQEPALTVAEINEQFATRSEESTIEWWNLILVGDATFKSLLQSGEVPPVDDWPPYLVYGTNVINEVITHWRNVPLASRGKLVEETPTE